MFNDYFEDIEVEEHETDIYFESSCCGYALESDIYNAIAEYQRSEVWD